MWRNMLKVAAATTAFGIVHSALAGSSVKRAAARWAGTRNRNGLYRVFYSGQSLVTLGLLADYVRRQPDYELYRIEGPPAAAMHVAQLGSLVYMAAAANQIGIGRLLGAQCLLDWIGDGPSKPEPAGQGPALDRKGQGHFAGPFAWSRHPLNFAMVPIIWLWPRMTTNRLAFNTVTTAYLVLGSLHEEVRLREAYGEDYKAYQNSGVAFFIPLPNRNPFAATASLLWPSSSPGNQLRTTDDTATPDTRAESLPVGQGRFVYRVPRP